MSAFYPKRTFLYSTFNAIYSLILDDQQEIKMSSLYKVCFAILIFTCVVACDSNTSDEMAEPQNLVDESFNENPPFLIAKAGVFNVGGELVEVHEANVDASESGTVWANQLLVRYFIPATENPKIPVVMMPGYGLASDIYLETPDGREGWAMQFIQAGHPVYLIEPANSTRAGINPEILNAHIRGREGDPAQLFTWAQELAWTRFGFGPAEGEFFDDGLMPRDSFDQLVKMFTPTQVETVDGPAIIMYGLQHNLMGLDELINRIGQSILLVHSATGVPGFVYAANNPQNIAAVINIEPVGCPAATVDDFPDVPVLSMFADHMEVREQMPVRQEECQKVVDELISRGVPAAMMALPAMGINGNSHLPMSELNSAELADLLLSWIEENQLSN